MKKTNIKPVWHNSQEWETYKNEMYENRLDDIKIQECYELLTDRHLIAKEYEMEYVPVVILDESLDEYMNATIRFNRAKGVHQIIDMSKLVLDLVRLGNTDEQIAHNLGMDMDEVLRLKQISGLKEAFANREFSKSWEEYEHKNSI